MLHKILTLCLYRCFSELTCIPALCWIKNWSTQRKSVLSQRNDRTSCHILCVPVSGFQLVEHLFHSAGSCCFDWMIVGFCFCFSVSSPIIYSHQSLFMSVHVDTGSAWWNHDWRIFICSLFGGGILEDCGFVLCLVREFLGFMVSCSGSHLHSIVFLGCMFCQIDCDSGST